MLRIIVIPVYLVVLYRAEYALRRYRPAYKAGSTLSAFNLQTTKDFKDPGGSFCFAEEEGNVFLWLWIELIAFQSQILVMFGQLLIAYLQGTAA